MRLEHKLFITAKVMGPQVLRQAVKAAHVSAVQQRSAARVCPDSFT
jgi:hypothetical protein